MISLAGDACLCNIVVKVTGVTNSFLIGIFRLTPQEEPHAWYCKSLPEHVAEIRHRLCGELTTTVLLNIKLPSKYLYLET